MAKKYHPGALIWVAAKVLSTEDREFSSGKGVEVEVYDPISIHNQIVYTSLARCRRRSAKKSKDGRKKA